ncbi:MAG TPA: amidohydrolase [Thermoanaerobaculaceae bacterium]|nr:amidohydrolase [Thermoanaerobaculaceae bacterium]HRS15155.1 amidohydrolase [Thermoanaerobaculaceae bacterium]
MECDLIITNGTVLSMVPGSRPLADGAVATSGGRIVAVAPAAELLEHAPTTTLLDAGGGLILPGFVNTHTHLAMTLLRGLADDLLLQEWLSQHIWPAEGAHMRPDTVAIGTRLAAAECIRAGVTTVCDMYFFGATIGELLAEVGLRAVVSEGLLDHPTPAAADPEDGLRLSRELLERFRSHPLVSGALAPHAPYSLSAAYLVKAAELAEDFGAPLMIHLAETRREVDEVLRGKGVTPAAYLADLGILSERTIAAHCVHVSPDDLELLAEQGVGVAANPVSNLKLSSGVAPVPQMLQAGVKVGFGTDGAASNNTLDLLRDAQLAALLYKGVSGSPTCLPARQLAEMLTLGGARVLGLDDRIGTLEVGKEADVVCLGVDAPHATPLHEPYSHLAYSARAADVVHVVVRGRVLMQNRQLLTIDEAATLAQARRVAAAIARR